MIKNICYSQIIKSLCLLQQQEIQMHGDWEELKRLIMKHLFNEMKTR